MLEVIVNYSQTFDWKLAAWLMPVILAFGRLREEIVMSLRPALDTEQEHTFKKIWLMQKKKNPTRYIDSNPRRFTAVN